MAPDYLAQYRAALTSEQCAWDALQHLLPGTADPHDDTWTAWWAAVHRCDDLHGPHGLLGPSSIHRDQALRVPAEIHRSVQQTMSLAAWVVVPSGVGLTSAGHRSGEGLASIVTTMQVSAAAKGDATPAPFGPGAPRAPTRAGGEFPA